MLKDGQEDLRRQMKKIGHAFVNVHEVSAQEAVFTGLGMHQCQASVKCEYVNTAPMDQRTRVLKNDATLQAIAATNPQSTDIYADGIIQHYSKRPESRKHICLADFATWYNLSKTKSKATKGSSDESDASDADAESDGDSFKCGSHFAKRRGKQKILRHRRYNVAKEPIEFMRENLMLYVPWMDELNEIVNIDVQREFANNKETIEAKSREYNRVNFDDLVEAYNVAASIDAEDADQDEDGLGLGNWKRDQDLWKGDDPGDEGRDMVFGDDSSAPKDKFAFVKNPAMLNEEEFHDLVSPLNEEQRSLFNHYVYSLRQQMIVPSYPKMHIFITGAAGVGKSLLIRAITQATVRIANKSIGVSDVNAAKILLTAPTGKAAFNIGGTTLHSAFGLPVHKFETVPPLSAEAANSLSVRMCEVKTLIVDEISMCSRDNFGLVDKRLRQIFGCEDEWFGGLNVLIFGDFYQLPPVAAMPIYSAADAKATQDPYDFLNGPSRWSLFKYFELRKVMRQRDDLSFALRLTRYGRGLATEEDCKFFESLREPQSSLTYCDEALHLFYDNKGVNFYNEVAIAKVKGKESRVEAIDIGEQRAVARAPKLDIRSKHGLMDVIPLKENAKYMVIANVDTEDGLVNGAVGILKDWDTETSGKGSQRVVRVWMQFEEVKIGHKARTACLSNKKEKGWTPLERRNEEIFTKVGGIVKFVRKQVPIVPALAISIHKSQGGTYTSVAVHLSKYAMKKCSAVYVALTRVTTSAGLTIYTEDDTPFAFPSAKPSSAISAEMKRLVEHEKLQCVYDNVPELPLVIAFNIRSLKKHLSDILNDPVMTSGKLLFFFETGLEVHDRIAIPGFLVRKRLDVRGNKKRGTILFVRQELLSSVEFKFWKKTDNFELIGVIYHPKCLIFGGYFAPSMSEKDKWKEIKECKQAALDLKCALAICGDFNLTFDSENAKKKLEKYNLHPIITAATTDNTTCIDNILTDSRHLRGIIYESVCSDHRPIIGKWSDEDVTKSFPFATASRKASLNAAKQANRISNSVPAGAIRDDVELPFSNLNIQKDSSVAEQSKESRVSNPPPIPDGSVDSELVSRAEQLLDQLRPLIWQTDRNSNFNTWPWLSSLYDQFDVCDEILAHVRDLVREQDGIRDQLLQLPTDSESARHLPLPLRQAYRPLLTTGDGSCFFHSISLLLSSQEHLSKALRLLSIFIYVRHREGLRSLLQDSLLLQEIQKTSITADDPECTTFQSCWADFMNGVVMSEILQRPLLIIDYSENHNIAYSDGFASAPSLVTLNSRIKSTQSQERDGMWTRYCAYVSRPEFYNRDPFVVSLSSNHYTALYKGSQDSPHLAFNSDRRFNISTGVVP